MTGHDDSTAQDPTARDSTAHHSTEPPAELAAQVPRRASETTAAILERLAERLGGRASVDTVFGEPVTRDGLTVIPVAEVAYGFGGGTGADADSERTGGGGGGGAAAKPLGFIEIAEGVAVYHPIRRPWTELAAPVAAVLVAVLVTRTARALAGRSAGRGRRLTSRG
ncbi:GerW family sporulation protein [Streptomyces tritici]|uniref:GerW family sporulation protein n=1 Tax=Streptomyces tritici TaxID=2054410 RepID=UPI003AEF8709